MESVLLNLYNYLKRESTNEAAYQHRRFYQGLFRRTIIITYNTKPSIPVSKEVKPT